MFTGIVKELGSLKAIAANGSGARLEIHAEQLLKEVVLGDSIAVNGCCLTVVALAPGANPRWFAADAVTETLKRTSLGHLRPGDSVNLERPLEYNGRLDGHLVQGHIDGLGSISSKELLNDGSTMLTVDASPDLLRYMVEKGSIAVDGVSLTITEVTATTFTFAMIPHTAKVTTLGKKGLGDSVNLEVDLMAKYVERLTAAFVKG